MNKKFTKLMAALALLTFLAVPMGMWGQSRESITVSYGWEDADDANQWTISSDIVKTSGQGNTGTYAGKINTNTTTVQYNDKVNVTSFSYAFKRTSTNSNYSVYIQTSTDGQTWNTVDTHAMSSFGNGTYTTVTKTFDGNTAYYVRFYCNNTTATRYVDDVTIVYNTTASTTFTVNYDCNGGETDCPENVSGIAPGTSITLASAPSRLHYNFIGWTYGATTYNPGDSYTVNSNVTFVAQWEPDGTYGEGSICFSNQSSCTAINSQSVTGEDDLGNTWSITTTGTSSFTATSGYYQVGSGNSPATSITFTTTLDEEVNVTDFSAMFGGFSATRASVVLKVDDTQVGSGTLNGAADVTVSSSSAQIGTTLTVVVTPTAGGVKCYNISYAYETIDNPAVATTTTINVPQDFNTDIYQGATAGTLTATVKDNENNTISGATVTWSSSNNGVATIDANGEVTLVAVGTTTITANYAGVEDQYRPSEGTYELTVTDSNAPGTQNNPYTVAQARAAIDAGTGTQGVYATGIVSSIETAWSTQYSNITFNFVDNAGDTDFLQAYRCVSGTGVDASTVAVGDIVVVHGNLTKYGSTYEFGQGCELVSLEHPTTPFVTVTPSTINAPFAGADGTLALAYENITNFISFDYYFCDANGNELEDTDPDYPGDWIYAEINDENEAYTLSYIIDANDGEARTAYMKVYTFDDNLEEVSAIVTVNQAKYVVDYATLPFAFNGGKDAIEETNGLTQSGLASDYADENTKLKFDSTDDFVILKINERPGILTFYIKGNSFSGGTFKVQTSADGVSYSDLKTYTTFGNNETYEEEFDNLGENVRYIKWIYTNKVSGNVGLGNIALAKYVAPPASITVSNDLVEVDAEEHDGTLDLTYESLTITDMTDFDIQFCDANGDELSEEPDWIEVLVAEQDPEIGEGYVVSYYMVENEGPDARTAYFKVYAMDDETNLVYSNLVTISQAAPVAPVTGDKYVKVTSTDDLTSGQYLIVYEEGSLAFDGGLETLDAASNTIEVTINDDEIGITNITTASEFTIDVTAGTIMSASGYYIGQTSDANGLASSTTTAYTNTISFDEDGNANIVSEGAYLRYNSASNQTRFRYYKSSSYTNQKAIQLYKKEEATPAGPTITVNGYGDTDGGYVLLAWPESTLPNNIEGMISDNLGAQATSANATYDLYSYDESEDKEWLNYRKNSFGLVPGKGYLYASKAGVTLTYEGVANPEFADVDNLPYTENNLVKSLYLAGNSKTTTETFYVYDGTLVKQTVNFLTINETGDGFITTSTKEFEAAALQGFFVQSAGEGWTLSTAVKDAKSENTELLNVMVSQNRGGLVDNAIVSFGNAPLMSKFYLTDNSTRIFIPQNGEEMAVVRSEAQGEMPVNFKAKDNGTYTLSIYAENVEMNYLHLIDNMTGMDVDLLQTPSYTFSAATSDYESRFKLVFAANGTDEADESSFAFFSNGNLIVNNEGNATLQVIDIMGRILSSETISGSCSKAINATTGVYMLRLINGDNVKVQKVVVR